jgi:hypothetical protein
MKGKWSKPATIDKETAPPKSGVYIIMNLKNLRRIDGVDPNGILYIGKSKHLQRRLGQFWSAYHPASGLLWDHPQIAGKYFGKRSLSQNAVGNLLGKLHVKMMPLSSKELSKKERALLFAYMYKFGEPPPLNFNLPGHWKEKPDKMELQWAQKAIS